MRKQFENTGRYFILCLSLIGALAINSIVSAEEIDGVGVDWEMSTMQVEFKKENDFVPNSTCFSTTTPDISCTAAAPFDTVDDECLTEDLDSLGYSDTNSAPTIDDCFNEAGSYRITINLVDFAGNAMTPSVSNLTVLAGTPDEGQSDLLFSGCPTDSTAPVANNIELCTLNLLVKDKYGNPVTQLIGQSANVYSDSIFPMDANNPNDDGSLSFRDGLLLGGVVFGDDTAKNTFTLKSDIGTTDVLGVYETFELRAKAPSMEKVGSVLARNEAFSLNFVFELPSIDADGSLDAANPITIRYDENNPTKYSPQIKFQTMVFSGIEVSGNGEFIIDVLTPMNILRHISQDGDAGVASNIMMGITHHYLPWALKFDPTFFVNDDLSLVGPFSSGNPVPSPDMPTDTILDGATVVIREGTADYTNNLSFSSVITYMMGSDKISYPGGAIGSGFAAAEGVPCETDTGCDPTELSVKLIGASIEGAVLGATDTTKLGTDTNNTIIVGTNKFKDIHEDIFKNTYRVIRSLDPITPVNFEVFNPNWYGGGTNVVLVEGDVMVNPGNNLLPTGKNTLVIKNGNLRVRGELVYQNKQDSFGFILINDEVGAFPEKGNLLINNSVKNIAGSFFLEGGVMTNNGLGVNTTIYESENAKSTNDIQLLLEGAILSHNTLGGGYESLYPAGATNYLTPWGDVDTLDTDNEVGYEAWKTEGKTDLEIAQAYDLHMVRYYKPEYVGVDQVNGGSCVCTTAGCSDGVGNAADCDVNNNAFVIRIDGRMKQLPPPGFETVTNIKW